MPLDLNFKDKQVLYADQMNQIVDEVNTISEIQFLNGEIPTNNDNNYQIAGGIGIELDIDTPHQVAFGAYNSCRPVQDQDINAFTLFAIGDGQDEDNRLNAFEVIKNVYPGEEEIVYDIRMGGVSLLEKITSIEQKLDEIKDLIASSAEGATSQTNGLKTDIVNSQGELIAALNNTKSELDTAITNSQNTVVNEVNITKETIMSPVSTDLEVIGRIENYLKDTLYAYLQDPMNKKLKDIYDKVK